MTWQIFLTLIVIFVTVWVLVRDLISPAVAVVGATSTLLIAGVVSPTEALSGFSNPAPITVAALYVVARAVEKTGMLQPLVSGVLGDGNGGRSGLARVLLPTAGASAFLNNTPIVAMLAPQVRDWADRNGIAASRYLMPLSFAAIVGGTITVIGTSTNLVVSGLLEAGGHPPIGMFEISWVGLPVALAAIAGILVLAPWLLPDRRAARQQFAEERREFVVEMEVERGGPLDGQTVEEGGLRHLQGVFLTEIERTGQVIAPAAPSTVLEGGDRLSFAGRADLVLDLHAMRGICPAREEADEVLNGAGHTYFEAVLSATSPLVGKTLREAEFRSRYQGAVLAIHRSGERLRVKLGDVRLRAGDTLILQSDQDFHSRWRDRHDFLLVSHLGGSPPVGSVKAVLVGTITIGIVMVAGLGLVPILNAALLGAVLLVLTGVLTANEARSAIDMDVVVLIAAAFGIGAAMQSSGLAAMIAAGLLGTFSGLGPYGILLGVLVLTVLFTELVTNNAAAVLVFPVAVAAAVASGLDPRPFAIAVAVMASASFLTPIGYQTNTMVYGPGGYRFTDYARLGLPMTGIVITTIMLVVPRVWPLTS